MEWSLFITGTFLIYFTKGIYTICPDPTDLAPCVCAQHDKQWIVKCENYHEADSIEKLTKCLDFISQPVDEVQIMGWSLYAIRSGVFKNITKTLRIIDCEVTVISNDAFLGIEMLEHLSLVRNNISTIPFNALKMIPILKELILAQNHILEIPNTPVDALKSLEYLDLGENSLGMFPQTSTFWESLGQLKKLALMNCGIPEIQDGVIAGLERLEYLSLNDNHINVISDNAFISLRNLRSLQLARTGLSIIPAAISKLYRLSELDLSENQIKTLPEYVLQGLKALQSLTLRGNGIVTMNEHAFGGLMSLQALYLEHNAISTLKESCFQGMPQLKALYLANNELREVEPYAFLGLASLRILDLRENRLETLNNMSLISVENTLTELHLQGNPIQCDCTMEWFILWIHSSHLIDKNVGTCANPDKLKDKTTNEIVAEDVKECFKPSNGAYNASTMGRFLIIVIILHFTILKNAYHHK